MIRGVVLGSRTLERAGVRHILEADDGLAVVGEGTVEQTSGLVRSARPDVLVVGHHDPDEAPAAPRAHRAAGPARVVLVGRLTDRATRMLLRHGARGVLLRDDGARHLPWAVRAAAAGSLALTPAAAGFVVDPYVRPGRPAEEAVAARKLLAALSPRERRILEPVGSGASSPDVADILSISDHTVKDHIRAIYDRFLVGNRVHAARILWQAGAGVT